MAALTLHTKAPPMRFFILAVVLITSSVAHADSGMLPGGATLQFNRLFLHEHNSKDLVQPEKLPDSKWRYFNYAHCVCGQSGVATQTDYRETTFAYEILLKNQTTLIHSALEIWVGSTCDDMVSRQMLCHQIANAGSSDIASIAAMNGIAPVIPVFDLMNPAPNSTATCLKQEVDQSEWALVKGEQAGTYDYSVAQQITTDSLPPPQPTQFSAAGAESAIQISWKAPIGNTSDIAYYQALCATAAGAPGRSDPPAARYVTPRTLCGATGTNADVTLAVADIDAAGNGISNVDAGMPIDAATKLDAAIKFDAAANAAAASDATVDAATVDAPTVNAGPATLIEPLAHLDPTYICGETTEATATSIRLEHLKNGAPYTVVLLAIDKYGNAAGTFFTKQLTPQPVTDFWEDLHNRGSKVQGGFCLIAETYGDDNPLTNALRGFRDQTLARSAPGRWLTDAYYATLGKLGFVVRGHVVVRVLIGILLAPLVGIALLWHVLTLPGLLVLAAVAWACRRAVTSRRRRTEISPRSTREGVVAASVGLSLVIMAPASAQAQAPYWQDPLGTQDHSLADEESDVAWHVGVRVGPYTPQIDSEPGLMKNSAGQGPYQAMFGGYRITPVVDIDRIVWNGFGQVGIGLSVGYMGKTAHAFAQVSDPNKAACAAPNQDFCIDPSNPNRIRSSGDTTKFRLIPLELTALYRFSYLDDNYGIPLVPYVRGGLGYYIWWSTAPSGDFSRDPMAADNQSRGASAGLVGAVGLQIRAERIDATAAQSMAESGIAHAGFYGELSAGWVNGFGSASKLNVGDKTWFAGVDFEF